MRIYFELKNLQRNQVNYAVAVNILSLWPTVNRNDVLLCSYANVLESSEVQRKIGSAVLMLVL